jgi:hypothetical protein
LVVGRGLANISFDEICNSSAGDVGRAAIDDEILSRDVGNCRGTDGKQKKGQMSHDEKSHTDIQFKNALVV